MYYVPIALDVNIANYLAVYVVGYYFLYPLVGILRTERCLVR